MPVEDSFQGSQQPGNFQSPGDPDLPEKVVSRIGGKQPAEKPDCLLVPGGWIAKLCVHGDLRPTGRVHLQIMKMAVALYCPLNDSSARSYLYGRATVVSDRNWPASSSRKASSSSRICAMSVRARSCSWWLRIVAAMCATVGAPGKASRGISR